jgi:hypothetical protein
VTGDESWFYLDWAAATKWSVSRDDVPTRVRRVINTPKYVLTVMWGVSGVHVIDVMTGQERFDSQYDLRSIMAPLVQSIYPHGRTPHDLRLHLHVDNCRVHFAKVVEQFLTANPVVHLPHPPYSPDLAPSEFWLFGRIKTAIDVQRFDHPDDLMAWVTGFLGTIKPEETQKCVSGLDEETGMGNPEARHLLRRGSQRK